LLLLTAKQKTTQQSEHNITGPPHPWFSSTFQARGPRCRGEHAEAQRHTAGWGTGAEHSSCSHSTGSCWERGGQPGAVSPLTNLGSNCELTAPSSLSRHFGAIQAESGSTLTVLHGKSQS